MQVGAGLGFGVLHPRQGHFIFRLSHQVPPGSLYDIRGWVLRMIGQVKEEGVRWYISVSFSGASVSLGFGDCFLKDGQ